MSNKPIIDIQVNSDQFKAFYELFEQFQAQLGSMPDDWKKIDAASKKAAKTFGAMAGGAVSMAEISTHAKGTADGLKKAAHAQTQFHNATRKSAGEMKKMAGYAHGLSKSIFGIGKYLFKVGALGGGLSLLGGFGLRSLGESAVRGQRNARGIGLNQGQIKAWNTDIGPKYVDSSILGKVANAQNTPQGLLKLSLASGIPIAQLQGMAPDEISHQLMLHERSMWQSTPRGLRATSPYLQAAMGFNSQEDIRRLAHSSSSGIASAWGQYKKDSGTFNISSGTTSAWYKFTRELSVAGNTLETVFTKRLSELAPVLGGFVKTLTADATAFINTTLTPANMKAFASGLQDVATYLGSKDFRNSVKSFGTAIVDVTHAVLWAAKVIGAMIGNPPGKTTTTVTKPGAGQLPNSALNPNWKSPNALTSRGIIGGSPGRQAQLAALDQKYGLPSGLLTGVYSAESNNGKDAGYSRAGALGPFQFMIPAANAYGVNDRRSFSQSSVGAAKYYRDLLKKYKGNVREAIGAYNWGPGNVDKDIAQHGKNWEIYAPKETRKYINKVVSVMIQNQTAAKVSVSHNAAAY